MADTTTEAVTQLQPALTSIANELMGLYAQGKAFTAEQAPELAKEIVRFGIAESFIDMACGVLVLWAAWWGFRKARVLAKECQSGDEPLVFGATLVSGVLFVIGVPWIACALTQLVKAALSPRLYVLKQAAALLK